MKLFIRICTLFNLICFSLFASSPFLSQLKSYSDSISTLSCDLEYSIKSTAGPVIKQVGNMYFDSEQKVVKLTFTSPNQISLMIKDNRLFILDPATKQYNPISDASQQSLIGLGDFYQYNFLSKYSFKEISREIDKQGRNLVHYEAFNPTVDVEVPAFEVWIEEATGLVRKMFMRNVSSVGSAIVETGYKQVDGLYFPLKIVANVTIGASSGASMIIMKNVKVVKK